MRFLLFLGNRLYSKHVLNHFINNGLGILACVSTDDNFEVKEICEEKEVLFYSNNDIQVLINYLQDKHTEEDYLISYLYPKMISDDLISIFNDRCINFHPAPLPEHRGIAGICFGIYKNMDFWGVTAHQLTSEIDAGDIIAEERFSVVPHKIYAVDLERITQRKLFELFRNVLQKIVAGSEIVQKKQIGEISVLKRKDLEQLKKISLHDKSSEIDKKIRALWLPPFHGAHIIIDGKKYTLVNEELLKKLSYLYSKQEYCYGSIQP